MTRVKMPKDDKSFSWLQQLPGQQLQILLPLLTSQPHGAPELPGQQQQARAIISGGLPREEL